MQKLFSFSIYALLLFCACDSKPKVVEPINNTGESSPATSPETGKQTSHKVKVEEVLQTKKYSYLKVAEENQESYWIAITKADVAVGESCIYTGGLKMRGFQSSELNRIFDEVILVSNISRLGSSKPLPGNMPEMNETSQVTRDEKILPVAGATKISEIIAHPENFEGKTITVTGRCTKINFQIMGRNWIHIEDGSKDKLELTITTQDRLDPGAVGIFEGKIALNKDFGAGYRYDIIMEEAKIK